MKNFRKLVKQINVHPKNHRKITTIHAKTTVTPNPVNPTENKSAFAHRRLYKEERQRGDAGVNRTGEGDRDQLNKDCGACPRIRLYINLVSAYLPKTTGIKKSAPPAQKIRNAGKKFFRQ